jgi:hypothetical protein
MLLTIELIGWLLALVAAFFLGGRKELEKTNQNNIKGWSIVVAEASFMWIPLTLYLLKGLTSYRVNRPGL